jgi:hypothetical protein
MTTDTDDLDACGDMLINGIDELQLRLQETIATSREVIFFSCKYIFLSFIIIIL